LSQDRKADIKMRAETDSADFHRHKKNSLTVTKASIIILI